MIKSLSFTQNLIAILSVAALFLVASTAHAASLVPLSSLQSGDLVRGQSFSAVYYYGADGFRYVFPNDKIYFTWYQNFNTVKWMSDDNLSKIQIGGNVTYKPGVKMIKINSDPRVYAVSTNGLLREIGSEEIAKTLYGSAWNTKIDNLPDGFFGSYRIGSRIDLANMYSPESEQSVPGVNDDKKLFAPKVIHVTDTEYSIPTIHLELGHAIQFINDGPSLHSVTEWDHIWGSGTMQPGDTFSLYPSKKGTWMYFSIYDPKEKMTGAIIVE